MVNKVERGERGGNGNSQEATKLGNVGFSRAPMNAGGAGGKPTKSPCGCGINKPMGDGLSKPATQWTKRS